VTDVLLRPVTATDLPALRRVIDATGLFPSETLGEMLSANLDGAGQDIWLTVDRGGAVAVAYAAPERMTEGTWNLYLIAVHPDSQGQGVGSAIVTEVETLLAAKGAHLLLVETSGKPEFERTRAFYRKAGYAEEARIRDFYQAGEDKVVFWKRLS
jgi:ribosomal protein S18 acetylase RimI-like enzyme